MAQDNVELIMRGIQVGQQKKARDEQASLEQQRIDSEVESRKAQIDFHKQELKQQKEFQDAQIEHVKTQVDLAKKAADMQRLVTQQQIAQHIMQGGEVPGDVKTPVAQGTGGASFSPVNPAAATSIQHSITVGPGQPNIEFTAPTEEAQAVKTANLQRILGKPAEEAKTREMQALQDAETTRQVRVAQETGSQRLQEINDSKQWDLKRFAATQAAENYRANANNAMKLRIAQMNLTGGLNAEGTGGGFPAQAIADNVYSGKISEEQLKKMYPKQAAPILSVVQKANGLPITDKEQQNLKDYEAVAAAVPVIKQMNEIVAQHRVEVLIPGTQAYKDYTSMYESVLGKVPAISRVLSGVTRFNRQEMDNYIKAIVPDKNPLKADPSTNLRKLNTFATDEVQNAFNTNFSRLPKPQREALKNDVGLNSLPYVGSQINPQTQASPMQQQPQGPQQPKQKVGTWTPNGVQWQNQ